MVATIIDIILFGLEIRNTNSKIDSIKIIVADKYLE